jgi:cysteine-rich repeat protein
MDLKNLKNSHLWLAVALTATVACGESGSESDRENNADAGAKEKNSSSAGTDSQAGQGGEDDEGTGEKQGTWCGDQKKQAAEQCDDGNNNDEDGCNTLCVFSCSRDDDCDDANPCKRDMSRQCLR